MKVKLDHVSLPVLANSLALHVQKMQRRGTPPGKALDAALQRVDPNQSRPNLKIKVEQLLGLRTTPDPRLQHRLRISTGQPLTPEAAKQEIETFIESKADGFNPFLFSHLNDLVNGPGGFLEYTKSLGFEEPTFYSIVQRMYHEQEYGADTKVNSKKSFLGMLLLTQNKNLPHQNLSPVNYNVSTVTMLLRNLSKREKEIFISSFYFNPNLDFRLLGNLLNSLSYICNNDDFDSNLEEFNRQVIQTFPDKELQKIEDLTYLDFIVSMNTVSPLIHGERRIHFNSQYQPFHWKKFKQETRETISNILPLAIKQIVTMGNAYSQSPTQEEGRIITLDASTNDPNELINAVFIGQNKFGYGMDVGLFQPSYNDLVKLYPISQTTQFHNAIPRRIERLVQRMPNPDILISEFAKIVLATATSEDETSLVKRIISLQHYSSLLKKNANDIMAGFAIEDDPYVSFVGFEHFCNREYSGDRNFELFPELVKLQDKFHKPPYLFAYLLLKVNEESLLQNPKNSVYLHILEKLLSDSDFNINNALEEEINLPIDYDGDFEALLFPYHSKDLYKSPGLDVLFTMLFASDNPTLQKNAGELIRHFEGHEIRSYVLAKNREDKSFRESLELYTGTDISL